MAGSAGLQGRKTNHTARKTTVKTLCRAEFQDSDVMQFTGHRNVSVQKPCLEQQRRMSHGLSGLYSGENTQPPAPLHSQPGSGLQGSPFPTTAAPSSSMLNGLFSGAQMSECTLNFNICVKDDHASCTLNTKRAVE